MPDLITVAYRGPLANKFRGLAESYGLSLAGLLQDALLAYEASVATGYVPGTKLEEWKGPQGRRVPESTPSHLLLSLLAIAFIESVC